MRLGVTMYSLCRRKVSVQLLVKEPFQNNLCRKKTSFYVRPKLLIFPTTCLSTFIVSQFFVHNRFSFFFYIWCQTYDILSTFDTLIPSPQVSVLFSLSTHINRFRLFVIVLDVPYSVFKSFRTNYDRVIMFRIGSSYSVTLILNVLILNEFKLFRYCVIQYFICLRGWFYQSRGIRECFIKDKLKYVRVYKHQIDSKDIQTQTLFKSRSTHSTDDLQLLCLKDKIIHKNMFD